MSASSVAYYAFLPHVADLECGNPAVRDAIAALLAPLLHALSVAAMADLDSEASVAAHDTAALLLAAGMYGAVPAAVAWALPAATRGRGRRMKCRQAAGAVPSTSRRCAEGTTLGDAVFDRNKHCGRKLGAVMEHVLDHLDVLGAVHRLVE